MNEVNLPISEDRAGTGAGDQSNINASRPARLREYDDGNPATVVPPAPWPAAAPDRWMHVRRDYTGAEVERLRGSFPIRHTLAERGANRLWELLGREKFVPTFGAFTGNQAVQHAKAGLKAIYLSGWQVAADANSAGQMYPDQSLYPVDSVPAVIRRMNRALRRADEIQHLERCTGEGNEKIDYMLPIVADAEALRQQAVVVELQGARSAVFPGAQAAASRTGIWPAAPAWFRRPARLLGWAAAIRTGEGPDGAEGCLVNHDGTVAYPVVRGVPLLTSEDGIALPRGAAP